MEQSNTSFLYKKVGYPIKHEREIAEEGFSILLVLLLGMYLVNRNEVTSNTINTSCCYLFTITINKTSLLFDNFVILPLHSVD